MLTYLSVYFFAVSHATLVSSEVLFLLAGGGNFVGVLILLCLCDLFILFILLSYSLPGIFPVPFAGCRTLPPYNNASKILPQRAFPDQSPSIPLIRFMGCRTPAITTI